MRFSLVSCAVVVVVLLAACGSASPALRRSQAFESIEWALSPTTGSLGLHIYTGSIDAPESSLYTLPAGSTVADLLLSPLVSALAGDSTPGTCSLRTGARMSNRALPDSASLAQSLAAHPRLALQCTAGSEHAKWRFVQQLPQAVQLEALRAQGAMMKPKSAASDLNPYPFDALQMMCQDMSGVEGWAKDFAEHHLGPLHPFPDYTTSKTQSGRWHLNTGAVLKAGDFSFGDESNSQVRLAIAADWGAGTLEADCVQQVMMAGNNTEYDAHWTLHVGDVYYTGTPAEVQSNCLGVAPSGVAKGVTWPHGSLGSFAVQGNHEMYSRGYGFFDTFLPTLGVKSASGQQQGQDAGFLSLENAYWRIIMLDTGYTTYALIPEKDDTNNVQPQAALDWLRDVVQIGDESDTRGIIFMTHHQVTSAFGQSFPATPLQVAALMPPGRTVVWLWGHEHRVSWYDMFALANSSVPLNMYGRCIGNGGYPGMMADLPADAKQFNLRAYDDRLYTIESGFHSTPVSYNGFVHLTLDEELATLTYSSLEVDQSTGRLSNSLEVPLVQEQFMAGKDGNVELVAFDILDHKLTVVQ